MRLFSYMIILFGLYAAASTMDYSIQKAEEIEIDCGGVITRHAVKQVPEDVLVSCPSAYAICDTDMDCEEKNPHLIGQ